MLKLLMARSCRVRGLLHTGHIALEEKKKYIYYTYKFGDLPYFVFCINKT